MASIREKAAQRAAKRPAGAPSHSETVALFGRPTSGSGRKKGKEIERAIKGNPAAAERVVAVATVEEQQRLFLEEFVETGSMRKGCDAAGIRRSTVNSWVENDDNFATRFSEATEDFVDTLEERAVERAKDTSDVLMVTLLKANRPAKYGAKVELSGPGGTPLLPLEVIRQALGDS
jgi:hypothetical protein